MPISAHWARRSQNWQHRTGALNDQQTLQCYQRLVPADTAIVLLGVTPQLTQIYRTVTAIEREPDMIQHVWSGNTDQHRVIESDWRTVELADSQCSAVLGDGSINMLTTITDIQLVFDKIYQWLKPGGRAVFRMFTRPEYFITEQHIRDADSFTVLRRYLNLYLAQQNPFVPIQDSARLYDQIFPDRPHSPTDLALIDSYRDSDSQTWWPTRPEVQELVPAQACNLQWHSTGTYACAELCPFLSFDK